MPLSLLTNTDPIPVVMQADDPNSGKQWSAKDGSGDGKTYGMDQLLEDITTSLEKRKVDTSTMDNVYDITIGDAINKLKGSIFDSIRTDAAYAKNRQNWLDNWNLAYQRDPNQDISALIVSKIEEMVDPTSGAYGDFVKIFKDKTTTLDKELVNGIDAVMNKLPSEITKTSINYADIDTALNAEIDRMLAMFHLDRTDAKTYPDVQSFIELRLKAMSSIDDEFDQWPLQKPDRPYRLNFDQAKAQASVTEKFEQESHTSEWANKLAAAAALKAKKDLQKILDGADASQLDTRTLGVIKAFTDWTKTTDGKGSKTPPELFKSLLGDITGQGFLDWMKKWGGMLKVSHTEYIKNDQLTVGIKVSFIDGAIVMPKEKSFPDLKIDSATLKIFGKDVKEEELKTPIMTVTKSSYSTDELKESYERFISHVKDTSAINEDNFDEFLAKLPTPTDISKLTDGQTFKDVTVDQIMKLNPEIFSNFDVQVDGAKGDANKQSYAKSWTSNLGITFTIEYELVGGVGKLKITPTIEDKAIETIPTFKWDDTIDDAIKASDATKAKIIQLFKDADKDHETITVPDIKALEEKLMSPLNAKATEVYNALKGASEVDPKPFEEEYNGKLKQGEEVSLDFIENAFPSIRGLLDKFKDPKSRFKIKFTISEWEETTKTMSVSYVITDTQGSKLSTSVDGPDTKNSLVTNDIVFNKDKNKAYKILDELAKSEKGHVPDFDNKEYVDKIGTRTKPPAMTDAEFKAFFKEYDKIHQEADDQKITITKRKVEYNTKTGRWEQVFSASYTAGTKNIVEEKAIPFTEKFLTQEEIDDAMDRIKSTGDEAIKTVDKDEFISDQDKKDFDTEASAAIKNIQEGLVANGPENVHQGVADMATEAAEGLQEIANQKVAEAKAKVITGKLAEYFGDITNVDPELLKLALANPDFILNILKNNPGLLNNLEALRKALTQWKINPGTIANTVKSLQLSGKIALLSLGGLLGIGAGIGGANAVKVATTNKKAVNAKTGKIKSSKKLAVLSAFIGLASLAGSIGTMLYLFLVQGGL